MIWADRVAISIVALAALIAALLFNSPSDSQLAFSSGIELAFFVWIVLRLLHFIGTGRLR